MAQGFYVSSDFERNATRLQSLYDRMCKPGYVVMHDDVCFVLRMSELLRQLASKQKLTIVE